MERTWISQLDAILYSRLTTRSFYRPYIRKNRNSLRTFTAFQMSFFLLTVKLKAACIQRKAWLTFEYSDPVYINIDFISQRDLRIIHSACKASTEFLNLPAIQILQNFTRSLRDMLVAFRRGAKHQPLIDT